MAFKNWIYGFTNKITSTDILPVYCHLCQEVFHFFFHLLLLIVYGRTSSSPWGKEDLDLLPLNIILTWLFCQVHTRLLRFLIFYRLAVVFCHIQALVNVAWDRFDFCSQLLLNTFQVEAIIICDQVDG